MDQKSPATEASNLDLAPPQSHIPLVRGIRRLLLTAGVAAFLCSGFMVAQKSGCVEATGLCYDLQLSAGPGLPVVFGAIVLFALSRILKRDMDAVEALRVLDRTTWVVVGVAVGAVVYAYAMFWAVDVEGFGSSGFTIFSPFPFGVVDVTSSPG